MITTSSGVRQQRVLTWCLGALLVLVLVKFVVILAAADWDLQKSPYGLLVVMLVPLLLLARLVDRRPRAGALLTAAAMLLWSATVVSALFRDGFAREAWADYPFAYGGLAIAVLAVSASLRLLLAAREERRELRRSARVR